MTLRFMVRPFPAPLRLFGLTLLLCGGALLGVAACDSQGGNGESGSEEERVEDEGQAPTFSITPTEHDFGFTHVGTPQAQTFSIVNKGEAPPDSVDEDGTLEGEIELVNDSNPERFAIERGGGTYALEPGDTLEVVVEFAPLEDQTASMAQIKVTHNGSEGGEPLDDLESPFIADLEGQGVKFEGGSGTSGDPYQITRPDQLQVIDSGLRDAHFVQVGNVDASPTSEWNEGSGFIPIGTRAGSGQFTGTFEGAGYVISNLQIRRSDENGVGLFAGLNETVIQDVVLRDARIVGGGQVGGVVGQNKGGEILRADVDGTVEGDVSVGGVAGLSFEEATIERAQTEATVNGSALVGGIVGRSLESDVSDAVGQGVVEGTDTPGQVGGLVGRNVGGEIRGSRSKADVSSSGERGQVGGLVGRNVNGVIRESEYSEGTVEGTVSAGGLVGANFDGGEIRESFASGTVISGDRGGGLVGRNAVQGTVLNSGTAAEVEADRNAGGLVGLNRDSVRGSWAKGPVQGDTNVGGLIGVNLGWVQSSYAHGSVDGGSRVGGLVGRSNGGTLRQAYAVGEVSGSGAVGGLAGRKEGGEVEGSYWDTESTGQREAVGTQEDASIAGEGLTTNQMTGAEAQNYMRDFDFGRAWVMVSDSYPILQWEQ